MIGNKNLSGKFRGNSLHSGFLYFIAGNRGQSPSVYGFWLNSLSHSSAYRYIILGEYLFIYKIYFYT